MSFKFPKHPKEMNKTDGSAADAMIPVNGCETKNILGIELRSGSVNKNSPVSGGKPGLM